MPRARGVVATGTVGIAVTINDVGAGRYSGTLWADANSSVALLNPLTTDNSGNATFWLDAMLPVDALYIAPGQPQMRVTIDTAAGTSGDLKVLGTGNDQITAFAGGGQAGATSLTGIVNRVTTVVSAFDSVKLPSTSPPHMIVVINTSANPMQVFGTATDTINGVAAATGIIQPPGSIDLYCCPAAGLWFVEPGEGFAGSFFTELTQNNVVAVGTNQASAAVCWGQTIRVTSGTGGIVLPSTAMGLEILVLNHSGVGIQIYGTGADQIDDIAGATGVPMMNNSMVIFSCPQAGFWYSEGLANGFGGPGLQTISNADALTARAGGGQGSATPINTMQARFTTVATAADSAILPANVAGLQIAVFNAAAANAMNVFPPTGGQINALGVNAAFSLAAGKNAMFACLNAGGSWHAILSA